MRISDWSSDVCSSDLLEQWLGVAENLRVEAVGHRVAEIRSLRAALVIGRVDLGEDRVQIEVVEMLGTAADLTQQFGAADDFVEARNAELGQDFAHFLGDEGDRKSTRLNSSH